MRERPIPSGWAATSIASLSIRITKGTTPTTLGFEYLNSGVLFVKVESLKDLRIVQELCTYIGADAHNALSRSALKAGDVLFSIAGTLGRVAVVVASDLPANTNQALAIIRPTEAADSAFLAQALVSESTRRQSSRLGRGVGLKNINLKQISELEIWLPPIAEQRRIVDRIEALQQRTRRARTALDAIPPLLEKFRQSVLASAFRGDLTAKWRAQNPDVEPASVLLERIREERRRRWEEAELEKMKAKGKVPSDDRWIKRYKKPMPIDKSTLSELPNGWVWMSLDGVLDRIEAGKSPKAKGRPASQGEYGVLKVSAVTWGEFDPGENKALLPGTQPITGATVRAGDLLISRANTVDLVGAVVLARNDYPHLMLSDKTLRLAYIPSVVYGEYLLYALRISAVRRPKSV